MNNSKVNISKPQQKNQKFFIEKKNMMEQMENKLVVQNSNNPQKMLFNKHNMVNPNAKQHSVSESALPQA